MNNIFEKIDNSLLSLGLNPISTIFCDKKLCKKYLIELIAKANMNIVAFQSAINEIIFEERADHTLMTFALGIFLSRFDDLKGKINKNYNYKNGNDTFLLTWILTSIFHDYGLFFQKEKGVLDKVQWQMFVPIREISNSKMTCPYTNLNIKCGEQELHLINVDANAKLLSLILYDNSPDGANTYLYNLDETIDFSIHRYRDKTYKHYHQMRMNDLNGSATEIYDHGILGGNLIYEELLKNATINTSINSKNEGFLYYLCKDISYKIMEHNMWMSNEETRKKYTANNLGELLPENYKKIDDCEPLLFLLCLADTIEFTKRVKNGQAVKLDFNDVDIEVEKEKVIIKCNTDSLIIDCEKYINGIHTLGDWICIKNENVNNTIMKLMAHCESN